MIFSTLLVSVLLFAQIPENEPLPPEIAFPPNEKTLADVLTAASAKVNPPDKRQTNKDFGHIFAMNPSITAPRVISSSQPDSAPDPSRKADRTGLVVVTAIVGADGKVHGARVERSLGKKWDEKALTAIKTWVFQPAMKDGHPVAVIVSIEITFDLYE